MRTNYKFHAIAISALCVIIIVLYALIGPSTPEAPNAAVAKGDRYIAIYSATWGRNCNQPIAEAIKLRESAPLPVDADGKILPVEKLEPVTVNNVLTLVGKNCDGRLFCSMQATIDSLELDPMQGCFKELDVLYRCFNLDRLNAVKVNQGKMLNIDCTKKDEPQKPAKAAAPAAR